MLINFKLCKSSNNEKIYNVKRYKNIHISLKKIVLKQKKQAGSESFIYVLKSVFKYSRLLEF